MRPVASVGHREAFGDWLRRPVNATVERAHGQVYVVALDFDVVGCGSDKQAASEDLIGQLRAYLYSFYQEGRSYDEARRPVLTPTSRGPTGRIAQWLSGLRRRRSNFTLSAIAPGGGLDAARPAR